MSYDLAVFDVAEPPRDRQGFMAWFDQRTNWEDGFDYNSPDNLTSALRTWFIEMIQSYPPMNGPLAVDDPDSPTVTDYSLGRSLIYMAFAWSQADHARATIVELAARHRVGFFDVSSASTGVYYPAADGALKREF